MLKTDSVNIGKLPVMFVDSWDDLDVNNLTAMTVSFKNQALCKITMSNYDN